MRDIVDDGEEADRSDGLFRQREVTVGRCVVRLADGHVAVCSDENREPNSRRLSDKDEWVGIESHVVPGDRTVSPCTCTDEPDYIVDGELNQPGVTSKWPSGCGKTW